jgi:hypothetical protein
MTAPPTTTGGPSDRSSGQSGKKACWRRTMPSG